jgi:hypothetical protein
MKGERRQLNDLGKKSGLLFQQQKISSRMGNHILTTLKPTKPNQIKFNFFLMALESPTNITATKSIT